MRRITDPAELAAYRRRLVPAIHAQHVKCKTGDAEAYIWTDDQQRPRAIAWIGRSMHPYSGAAHQGGAYWFKTTEKRAAWIAQCFSAATSQAERTAKNRAEKAAQRAKPHDLQVGDVLRSSWGYDQTNIDYYQVTALIGTTMVEYREIGAQSEATGHMTGNSVPAPGAFVGPVKRARVSDYGKRDSIRVSNCAHAYKMQTVTVAGIVCYNPSGWTAYA